MVQLPCLIEQAPHTPVAPRPAPWPRRPGASRAVRALLHLWQWACSHAERPERVVPYC